MRKSKKNVYRFSQLHVGQLFRYVGAGTWREPLSRDVGSLWVVSDKRRSDRSVTLQLVYHESGTFYRHYMKSIERGGFGGRLIVSLYQFLNGRYELVAEAG